jgi:hypothetical protein
MVGSASRGGKFLCTSLPCDTNSMLARVGPQEKSHRTTTPRALGAGHMTRILSYREVTNVGTWSWGVPEVTMRAGVILKRNEILWPQEHHMIRPSARRHAWAMTVYQVPFGARSRAQLALASAYAPSLLPRPPSVPWVTVIFIKFHKSGKFRRVLLYIHTHMEVQKGTALYMYIYMYIYIIHVHIPPVPPRTSCSPENGKGQDPRGSWWGTTGFLWMGASACILILL